jgi:serine phosphatase RsbU (regulator of sigma subunit)
VGYTDGIIEARNPENELYGLDRLAQSIGRHGRSGDSLQHIYQCIIDDVRVFMGSETFGDDVSCFLFRRDSNLDVISDKAELDALLQELDTNQRTIKLDLKGKTRAEIQEEIRKEKKKTELKARLANMEQLYKMGEY